MRDYDLMKIIFLFVCLFVLLTFFFFFGENMMRQGNPEQKWCLIIYSLETKKALTKVSASRYCYKVFNKCC